MSTRSLALTAHFWLLCAAACGGAKPQPADRKAGGGAPLGPAGPGCEEVYAAYLAEHPARDVQAEEALDGSTGDAGAAERTREQAATLSTEAYGAVLSHGSYFLHCDAPETLEIKICAAIRHGRALGVSVETNPSDPRVDACIDRAVRRLRFLTSSQMELTRTFFPAEGTPPWGNPRRAPSEEARVAEFLRALPGAPDLARSLCAKVVVTMPGLWKELVSADPSLEKRGTPGATIALAGGPNAEQGLRIFDDGPELEALLASPAFASFARRLSAGRIRAANAAERELTYRLQMVAFTPDTPITVVEVGNQRVAFLLAEGRVYWIERLTDWSPK